jgi:toxin ParE1/3/4
MKVRWTVPAAGQLEQAYHYMAESNADAAEQIADHFVDITEMLGKHPGAGRRGRVPSTREFHVPDTPFTVAYSVSKEIVWILAVYNAARKWPERF